MATLKEEHKVFIVSSLACFRTPAQVVEALREEYAVEASPQQIQYYDPTKGSKTKRLPKKWKAIFDRAREMYVTDTASVGIAHQRYRLDVLQRVLNTELDAGARNKGLVLEILERGAKEVGGLYTNRREHKTLRDLSILRNTIYARRGRTFKSEILRDHFSGMEWYKPVTDYSDKLLSANDVRNISMIKSVENEFGGPLSDEDWLTEPATDGA